jgi:uncharacterized repeat protein (TIGR01451 family)
MNSPAIVLTNKFGALNLLIVIIILCLIPCSLMSQAPSLEFLSIGMNPISIYACDDLTEITVTIENTGDTDAHEIDLAITLPSGITFNPGSAQAGLGTDVGSATAVTAGIGDPFVSGRTLCFYDFSDRAYNLFPAVQWNGEDDTMVLRFTVQSHCYVTDNLFFDLRFYDSSGIIQHTTTTTAQLNSIYPNLSITKTANPTLVNCGGKTVFTIQVTNNGTGNAQVVRVVDTLGDWLDYSGSFTEDFPGTVTIATIGGNPQIKGWEFNNMAVGATATFSFEATFNPDGFPNQNDCSALLRQNSVKVQWGCGTFSDAVDDDPNTTGYDCTQTTTATAALTMGMPNLRITSVNPTVNCAADGSLTGNVAVAVDNNGPGDVAHVPVQLTSTGSYTFSNQNVTLADSGSSVLNFAFTPTASNCSVDFTATIDPSNTVCECSNSDNSRTYNNFAPNIPDLAISGETLSVSCAGDGQIAVSGNITLANNGCGPSFSTDVPMRFSLYNNTGCSGNMVDQWTEALTGVSLAGSSTQTFVISHTLTSNMCSNSTGCQVSIGMEVDYNNSICEFDGTNNTFCADNKIIEFADLVVNSVTPAVNQSGQGTVTVNVGNIGCSNVTGAVVQIASNCGLTFTNQTVDLAASTTSNVIFNFAADSTICNFTADIDPGKVICECDGTNNHGSTAATGSLEVTKVLDWKGVSPITNQTFEICISGPSFPNASGPGACKTLDYHGGILTFTNLTPGNYTVTETKPGTAWTTGIAGSPATVLPSGTAKVEIKNTFNIGKVSGQAFCDANGDGDIDANEPGISNVALSLLNKTGPQPAKLPKTLTDSNGHYRFVNVPLGNYVVTFDANSFPQGSVPTSNGLTYDVTLGVDAHCKDANFGLCQLDCSEFVEGKGTTQPNLPAGKKANDLVFVSGSQTFGGNNYSWHNAVDGDYQGWDGTTLACGNVNPAGPASAIFQFADGGKYMFNYIAFQTDNGTADDGEKYNYQTLSLNVLVSTTGKEDSDFTSVGLFNRKGNGKQIEWHKLLDYVEAKFVKLELLSPNFYNGNWRQIVEFEVHDGATKKGASPASNNNHPLAALPESIQLMDAYPNPFNAKTMVEYNLVDDSNVSIKVFDLQGREIDSLVEDYQLAGFNHVVWDAQRFASGTYFIVMQAGQLKQTKKVILLK